MKTSNEWAGNYLAWVMSLLARAAEYEWMVTVYDGKFVVDNIEIAGVAGYDSVKIPPVPDGLVEGHSDADFLERLLNLEARCRGEDAAYA